MINQSIESLSTLIFERLLYDFDDLSKQFQESIHDVGVRYCYIDNLLPNDLVNYIYKVFPNRSNIRLMESFREKNCTSEDYDDFVRQSVRNVFPCGLGKKDIYKGSVNVNK